MKLIPKSIYKLFLIDFLKQQKYFEEKNGRTIISENLFIEKQYFNYAEKMRTGQLLAKTSIFSSRRPFPTEFLPFYWKVPFIRLLSLSPSVFVAHSNAN